MPNVYTFKDFDGSSHRILIDLIRQYGAVRAGVVQAGVVRASGALSEGAPEARTTPACTTRRLLDLGAAGGHLGRELRDAFDETIGFEYNVDCIGELRGCFDQVVIADLERVAALPSNLDAVVLADVLEHLVRPKRVLELVHQSLKDDGRAFISVPNIANITIRLGLLFGVFEYRERGILDHTHLRFYTMRTFRREVESAGFRILAVRGSSVPVRLIVDGYVPNFILRPIERVLTWITRLWRSLFAYQFVVVAAKK